MFQKTQHNSNSRYSSGGGRVESLKNLKEIFPLKPHNTCFFRIIGTCIPTNYSNHVQSFMRG